ncbi:hypothetical protein HYH03_007255 [Edaphochlamys debaryana]|uniref:TFIIE beta domain-containing protein n=1 Tax=Edaphochlamys debaryana TaxID=47281 RepID=A0A836BZ72_9CHLO|nr:hypothetical protein HYH03_007255 [Edaphochlamys debaryana]|eukprot:KAG2494486.1 hypothetical protein HYH03_007255 [Edaphochlamys debaryana]
MSSLDELLANINSGSVPPSDAIKRQPRKAKPQSDLTKRLRGQAGAVNTSGEAPPAKPAGGKRGGGGGAAAAAAAAASRATPPPTVGTAAAAGSAPGSGGSGGSAPPSGGNQLTLPNVGPVAAAAPAAPAQPPPLSADAPLAARMKRVLDVLRMNRETHTFSDLKSKLNVDLKVDTELLDSLKAHQQLTYDSMYNTLKYKPKVLGINNATDLLNYLRRHTTVEGASAAVPMSGVRVADVADAYIGLEADLKRLQGEGQVYIFGHTNPGQDVVYAAQPMNIGPVSDRVVEMFHNTRVAQDMLELQWAAKDLGLKSALATRPMRVKDESAKDKKKKRRKIERKFNVDKATNAHMRELFEGAQPKNIETK